jgi:hypothetical protein
MCPTREAEPLPDAGARLPSVEDMADGVFIEWIEDRRIVVYHTPDSSRPVLQALFDRGEQIIRDWPTDKPYLSILDFSSDRVSRTPYARERGRALMLLRPELHVCMSMLMSRSVQAQLFQLMARTWQRGNRQLAVHFSREEAVAWLKKVGGIA